jgi:hypothetical protein
MKKRDVTLEDLHGYLDDALTEEETARVENALRHSASLRQILHRVMQERDRGEHSLGAIWRRERISCPSREEMASFLLGVLEEGQIDYIKFHLETIGCAWCKANLHDLQSRRKEPAKHAEQRRLKLFTTSAGYLRKSSGG